MFSILLFAYVLSQFFRAFLAIVAGELSRDLGLDAAQLGDLSAVWFASFALAQFPVGLALDKLGPRRTMGLFFVLAVAGAGAFAAATSFTGALAAMALIGVGCSPVLMSSMYVFGRLYPPERFAMLSSLMIGLGSAGNLLGAAPLAWSVQAVGWRASMAAIAAVTALSCALAVLLLRDPPALPTKHEHASFRAGLGQILRLRVLWLMLPLALTSYAVVIAVRSLWIAPFLGQVHGFDAAERGNAALVMAVAMSLGALAYGPVERYLGDARLTCLIGGVVTGLALLALGMLGDRSAALALALLAFIGAAGLSYGILMAHARTFFPPGLLGRGVTFMNFLFIAGAGVVQWASGRFVRAGGEAGDAPSLVFGQLHTVFGALLLAACAVYAFAPSRAPE
ncbi:MFS transporter [Alsobacter ponti]|uniref:MFS transporter n=1 Tax=Alsobacter ponti TaxID=2962936 RepID=UPI0035306730